MPASTISDVARRAGVSSATVSRVVNGLHIVRPELVQRVNQAIEELGYRPNRHARALTGKGGKTVGVLVFTELRDVFQNPFWGEAVSTVHDSLFLQEFDCNIIALGDSISSSERLKTEGRYLDFLKTRGVDGFVAIGLISPEQVDLLGQLDVPTVIWGKAESSYGQISTIDTDNYQAAVFAVSHLVSCGRSKIAEISGNLDIPSAKDRHDGFVDSLRDLELEHNRALASSGDYTMASGKRAMEEILASGKPFDALFAANDEMAIGAIDILNAADLLVPATVSVVGVDHVLSNRNRGDISVTSIEHDYPQIGKRIVELLVDLLGGGRPMAELVKPKLVMGDSTSAMQNVQERHATRHGTEEGTRTLTP